MKLEEIQWKKLSIIERLKINMLDLVRNLV